MMTSSVRPPATRLKSRTVFLAGGLLVLVFLALASWLMRQGGAGKAPEQVETSQAGTVPEIQYTVAPAKPEPAKPEPVDTIGPQLAAIMARLKQMQAELDDLKNRKPTQTIVQQRQEQKTTTVKPAPANMLFVSHEVKDTPPVSKVPLYLLAPATYLPCAVETKIVSDVEGYFVCTVTTNVYDTRTRRHLLVPQGSKVLGNDQANELIYGSERMDTISLTLRFPDGRSVDLGRAPVIDNEGVAGLAGDVNHHWWRLFGAVFIGGALKGGMTAMQTAISTAAGAGQVAAGIGSLGTQATTTKIQPYINTRPTITTFAGQLGNVLLIKELALPAMW